MTRIQWMIAALLVALAAGCFEPGYEEGIECSETGTCPPGMTCDPMNNRCWTQSRPGVCGDGVVNDTAGEICDPGRDGCCAASCDALLAAGTECRPSAGPCDSAEVCTGTTAACPSDELAPAMTECRAGSGMCEPAAVCDGVSIECPSNVPLPNGSSCSDCPSGLCDVCMVGICTDLCGNGTLDTVVGEQCEVGNDAACPGHCANDCTCAYPRSCLEYLTAVPGLPNGNYTIDPDGMGTGEDPFEVYCDMVTDGGGWTLIMNQVPGADLPDEQTTVNPSALGSLDRSYRLGNPVIAKIAPTSAWKLTDESSEVFFESTCVVDWSINYLGMPPSPCTIGYTTEQFVTPYNGGYVDVSTRGIGINNGAQYCSIRAYNSLAPTSFEAGPAASCLYTRDQIVRLWYR